MMTFLAAVLLCPIVVGTNPSASDAFAAEELRDHLKLALGADVPILTETPASGAVFELGTPQARKIIGEERVASLQEEESIYVIGDGVVAIAGGGASGLCYGVYSYLERELGIRWYDRESGPFVPAGSRLDFTPREHRERPRLPYRLVLCTSGNRHPDSRERLFFFRNRINQVQGNFLNCARKDLNGKLPVRMREVGQFAHTFFVYMPPDPIGRRVGYRSECKEGYFADHPDWYSLDASGKRTKGLQLCFTNPGLRAKLTENFFAAVKKNGGKGFFDLSARDAPGEFCHCADCQALVREYKAPGAPFFDFLQELAPKVKALHPDVVIHFLAYRKEQAQRPPVGMPPWPDNVAAVFAPIDGDFSKDFAHPNNAGAFADLKEWCRQVKVWMWYYPFAYRGENMPTPGFRRTAADTRLAIEAGLTGGYYEHDVCTHTGLNFADAEMWMILQHYRDPDRDWRELRREWFDCAYGAASGKMIEFSDILERRYDEWPAFHSWDGGFPGKPAADDLARWNALFDAAEESVADDVLRLQKVREARFGVDLLTLSLKCAADPQRVHDRADRTLAEALARRYDIPGEGDRRIGNLGAEVRAVLASKLFLATVEVKPLPKEFDGISADRLVQVFQGKRYGKARYVKMEDAAPGYATRQEPKAAGLSAGSAYKAGIYDADNRLSMLDVKIPTAEFGKGAFRFHRLGTVEVPNPNCFVWFGTNWTMQFPMTECHRAGDNGKWAVWASLKFMDDGAVACDRIVCVREEALPRSSSELADADGTETIIRLDSANDSLEAGRDKARALKKSGHKTVVVELKGDFVRRSGTLELTSEDSGVVWRAAPEGAAIRGSIALPAANFRPVTEQSVRSRLKPSVRDRVLMLDLASVGAAGLRPLPDQFLTWPSVELFSRGRAQTLARYPNRGFLSFTNSLDRGAAPRRKRGESCGVTEGGIFQFDPDANFSRWDVSRGIWMFGFWSNDWYSESLRVKSIDPETRAVALCGCHAYGIGAAASWQKAPRRYFVFNVLEELDAPGEWCLDVSDNRIYWLPPDGEAAVAELSWNADALVRLRGVRDVSFVGIEFSGSRANWAVMATGCERVEFRNVRMHDMTGSGLSIFGGRDCLVSDSRFLRMGVSAVYLEGGDRRTLTPCGHRMTGCEAACVGRLKRNGGNCLRFGGVGIRVDGNYFHDVPYIPITYTGNEHLIERNEIAFAMMESGDGGAIYTGRDWGSQGTVVRGNWIHHMGKAGVDFERSLGIDNGFVPLDKDVQVSGVYLDDCDSGETVTNNLFYKAGWAVIVGGGRNNTVSDNLVLDGSSVINFDVRGEERQRLREWKPELKRDLTDGWDLIRKLENLGYDHEPWRSRYPQLVNVMQEHPEWPMGCVFSGNVSIGCPVFMNSYGKSAPILIRDHLEMKGNVAYGGRGRFDKVAFRTNDADKVSFRSPAAFLELLKRRGPLAIQDDPAFREAHREFPRIAVLPEWAERARKDGKGYAAECGTSENHIYGGWR